MAKKVFKQPGMLGKPVQNFTLPSTGGATVTLPAHGGRKLDLYFYPKDNTPGCTTEGIQFRDLHKDFRKAGCEIFGVSRDSLKSHEGFKAKLGLPFELLCDAEEAVCTQFRVIKMKTCPARGSAASSAARSSWTRGACLCVNGAV